ncbi:MULTISPECIES: hypothetical protein [Sphingomonas]|uniref:hypothetical protein n=1 Tax=Sphingomonas TaxID=13687 RepID=UPI000DEF2619|nr:MULTISPECIES: hypothetical protein [Sphingomonas]
MTDGLAISLAIAVAIILNVTATLTLRRFLQSAFAITVFGGMLIPAMVGLLGLYELSDMQVDSPPPGALLIGGAIMIAILTPCTLLISWATNWAANRWQRSRRVG